MDHLVVTNSIPPRYRVIAPLGSGGMATVVLAEDTVLGREVALKRMTALGDARGLSRLRREALVGASVSHLNLVSVFDVIAHEDGDVVIVMEYVDGETLRDRLQRQGRLPAPEALRILGGVAAGLDAIHARGIVHRDVKPANILLGADGTVKVADLGIAVVHDRTRITTAGAVLGTFSYMAPEQLEDAPSRPAVDIYALAAVAYETLAGRKARREPNPVALAHAISTQPPPDLREAWPGAPQAAAQLLTRGMSRDPHLRPRSAGELISRLRAGLEPESTAVLPGPPPARVIPARAARAEPARPAGPAVPASAGARSQSAPRRAASVLLALVLAAVALTVVLSGGSSSKHTGGARPRNGSPSVTTARSTKPSAGDSAGATGTRSSAASTPAGAVKTFYGLASAHRYADAWLLADPTLRAQVAGYQAFRSQQAGDISIRFSSAQTVNQSGDNASVAVRTTSVRTDGTKHCSGTVDLVRAGAVGHWLLHLLHLNCV